MQCCMGFSQRRGSISENEALKLNVSKIEKIVLEFGYYITCIVNQIQIILLD